MAQTAILDRWERIDKALEQWFRQKPPKEGYTPAEVAEIIGKSDYTVREYCRKGQIRAEKAPNGRGWLVSHVELERLRNYGPLPEQQKTPTEPRPARWTGSGARSGDSSRGSSVRRGT